MYSAEFATNLDGMLCVRSEWIEPNAPEKTINWWPTGTSWRDAAFNGITEGARLTKDSLVSAGTRYLYQETGWMRPIVIELENGGKCRAVKFEVQPIPCPRVRKGTETRWYHGHWQKRLKRGWVAI